MSEDYGWPDLHKTVDWLEKNGTWDEGANSVDSETAKQVKEFLDLAEAVSMKLPKIFWHGGDAVVLTWGEPFTARPWMITFSGTDFHVHYPKPL